MQVANGWSAITRDGGEAATLYQVSLISALAQGVYDGTVTLRDLLQQGDFGLGTFSALDGEMVGFDGQFYHLRSDGSATPVRDEETSPFASVTRFRAERLFNVSQSMKKDQVYQLIQAATERNLVTAVRIRGEFSNVTTRTVKRQSKPYPPLADAAAHETKRTFAGVHGTLAGFLMPAAFQGLDVEGFHLHFLADSKSSGGHCLDFTIGSGLIEIALLSRVTIDLPTAGPYLNADLRASSVAMQIKKAEG